MEEKKKSRMLFVDDRSKRIHSALRQWGNDMDITIAPNAREALRLLSSQDWDIVSLDHDLDGCDYQDPDDHTSGMEIIRYIEKMGWPKTRQVPYFIIHSSNLFAATAMEARISALGFPVHQKIFVYDQQVEHMKYDKEGLPIL
jgi:CheY-like chemotaxis protein